MSKKNVTILAFIALLLARARKAVETFLTEEIPGKSNPYWVLYTNKREITFRAYRNGEIEFCIQTSKGFQVYELTDAIKPIVETLCEGVEFAPLFEDEKMQGIERLLKMKEDGTLFAKPDLKSKISYRR